MALPISSYCSWAALLLAILPTASALADSASEAKSQQLFSRIDRNEDGQIGPAEVEGSHARLFARLLRKADRDGNGQLSAAEFQDGLTSHRPAKALKEKPSSKLPGSDALLLAIARMDANGDRQIVADEVPEVLSPLFQQMLRMADADKDGKLERRELSQFAPRLGIMAMRVAEQLGVDVKKELAELPKDRRTQVDRMRENSPRPGEFLADPKQARELFLRLDENGDGYLVVGEIPDRFTGRFKQASVRADRDGDRRVSKKEFLAAAQRMAKFQSKKPNQADVERKVRRFLRQFDRNEDNRLSRDEVPDPLKARFATLDDDDDGLLDRAELQRAAEFLARFRR